MDPSLPSGAWRLGRGNCCCDEGATPRSPHPAPRSGRTSHLHAGPFLPPSAPPGPEPGPPALRPLRSPSAPISPAGDRPRSPVPSQEAPPPGLSCPPIGPPAAPRRCLSWLPRRPLAIPDPPRKFEKKKVLWAGWKAGAAPEGKGREERRLAAEEGGGGGGGGIPAPLSPPEILFHLPASSCPRRPWVPT